MAGASSECALGTNLPTTNSEGHSDEFALTTSTQQSQPANMQFPTKMVADLDSAITLLSTILLRLLPSIRSHPQHYKRQSKPSSMPLNSSNPSDIILSLDMVSELIVVYEALKYFYRDDLLEKNRRMTEADMRNSFGKLPTELRLKIWGFAAKHPVVVGLMFSRKRSHHECFPETNARCNLLHVCKEARAEALITRKNVNSVCRAPRLHPLPPGASKIYVDLEVDTLWLRAQMSQNGDSHFSLSSRVIREGFKGVRRFAADFDLFEDGESESFYDALLGICTDTEIREIFMVYDSEYVAKDEVATLVSPRRSYREFPGSKFFPAWISGTMTNHDLTVNSWEDYDTVANKAATAAKVDALESYNWHMSTGNIGAWPYKNPNTWTLPHLKIMEIISCRQHGSALT